MMAPPPGLDLILRLRGRNFSFNTYRYMVLLLTFIAYACYHASRKPTSIVKSVLDPEPPKRGGFSYPWPVGELFVKDQGLGYQNMTGLRAKGWPPFNGKDGTVKLGEIDVAFLACYSLGMYVAGHLGDSLDLRVFLTVGMMGSGIFVMLFGAGYFSNVHSFAFYLVMQMIAGLFQATGWPSVVAVVGNWFGKRKRGLIMGIWNAHTSIGNITGSLLAVSVLQHGWGWSFILPGALIFCGGLLVYLFLPAYPENVGLPGLMNSDVKPQPRPTDEEAQLHGLADEQNVNEGQQDTSVVRSTAVGLLEAFRIPGVIPFSWCLFFSKLVAYTFLYWLPFYLSQTAIGGEYVSVKSAGNLSTLFDVGGIIGGILAGHISDKLNARATTAAAFMYIAIPSLVLYRLYGGISQSINIGLMMLTGLFVNGPYALITTAVSADLGTHSSLKGNSRALATVTAIIDGTGSLGAALGPLLTGIMSTWGWNAVFAMLCIGALAAAMLLSHLVAAEIQQICCKPTSLSDGSCQAPRDSVSEPLLGNVRR